MWMALLCLLLLCSHYAVAQDGGCNPSPPSTLFSSGPPEKLYDNKVPKLNAQPNILQPIIGGQRTDIWAMFSAAQLRQHGLWCQVREEDTNNMPNDNVGNWYYPSTEGYTLLTNTTTDGTPYQSLKCTNQIGLVVDGDLTNYHSTRVLWSATLLSLTCKKKRTTLQCIQIKSSIITVSFIISIVTVIYQSYLSLCAHSWSNSRSNYERLHTLIARQWSKCCVHSYFHCYVWTPISCLLYLQWSRFF